MPYGIWKDRLMQDVPASYLHWLWTNGKKGMQDRDAVADYIHRNLDALRKDHPDGIWS